MQPTKVLNGSQGFAAMCFAQSVMVNQLAFYVGRAMNKKQDEAPAFDTATLAALDEAFGDSGLPKATVLNTEQLIEGHAAAFILLRRSVGKPDPETGRKPEHLIKRLVPLPDAVVASVGRLTEFNLKQGRAEAAKIGADFTKREAAIRAEMAAEARRQLDEVKGPWITAIKAYADGDTGDLIDIVLEAVVDAGMDPAAEIRRAADLLRDNLRQRIEAGNFAKMETSIYALCSASEKKEAATTVTAPAAPSSDGAAPAAA